MSKEDLFQISDDIPPSEPQSLIDRYHENIRFFSSNLEVYPTSFLTKNAIYLVHQVEDSVLEQYRRPGIPTITYFVGPPRSGKTSAEFQKNKIMLDRGTGRIQSIAKVTGSRVINHRLEWGEGVFKQPDEDRVYGDYHTTDELHASKQAEANRAAADIGQTLADTICGINTYGREYAAGNAPLNPEIHTIDIDGPGIAGVLIEEESANDETILIDHTSQQTVGLIRDSELLKRLVHREGEFKDLEYDLFVVGMTATADVETYAYETRKLLEHIDTDEGFAQLTENEKMQEKLRILKDRKINLNLSDQEARHFIDNMAKTYQMDGIMRDVNQVLSYWASKRKIRSKNYYGEITPEVLENNPALREELLPQAMRIFLQEYIGVPDDKGAILINRDVSVVVVEEADLTSEVRRPMIAMANTHD